MDPKVTGLAVPAEMWPCPLPVLSLIAPPPTWDTTKSHNGSCKVLLQSGKGHFIRAVIQDGLFQSCDLSKALNRFGRSVSIHGDLSVYGTGAW